MIQALLIMIVVLFVLVVFYGAIAPALEPLFRVIETFGAVTSSGSPVGASNVTTIEQILFMYGPLLFLAVGIGYPLLYAIRKGRSTS